MSQTEWTDILGWGPDEVNDLRVVAHAYIQQGIYETALVFLDAITILAPPSIYDLQTLGALHLQMGHPLKALDYLDRALKADPSHLITQLNRSKALFLLGYKRQGLAQALELEKCPEKEIAAQAAALVLSYR